MPAIYSNQYARQVNANGQVFSYAGPNCEKRGDLILRLSTYTGAITFNASPALNDVLYITGGFLAGERIHSIINTRSGDPDAANDFTFNLGFRLGTATTFASTSTAMQAAVAFEVTPAAAAALATNVAAEGDDLILTATAGAAEVTTVVHSFIVISYIP